MPKQKKIGEASIREFAELYNTHGTCRAAGARMSPPITHGKATMKRYNRAKEMGLIEHPGHAGTRTREELVPPVAGRVEGLPDRGLIPPAEGQVRRYILTCAQNNTHVNKAVWENLLALARHYDAAIMVSRFVYDKRTHEAMDKSTYAPARGHSSEVSWEPELVQYLVDERVTLAPGLVFCGEMNILPTAVRPLSGMEAYTGRKSAIFPHVKVAMESVPSGKHEGTKLIYTTGTVTQRNYIQRKAGLKADFHHVYGALLVEVDSDGDWFVRQLNADSKGIIYDLDIRVENEELFFGQSVEGINWGDIHASEVDPIVLELAWAKEGMLDVLRSRYQFFHDIFSFRSRWHHDRRNPHVAFQKYVDDADDVAVELKKTGDLIEFKISRPWCEAIVVESNHDNALERWLRDEAAWYAQDPKNAVVFLELQLAKYRAMEQRDEHFLLIEHALRRYSNLEVRTARFLRQDESYLICSDAGGGIECGMHGYLGPNGAQGGAAAFAKMGRKANVGHSHVASIRDGIYTAGTSSLINLPYNRGPSSRSHSHIITYVNGKRAIITMWSGKWRA